MTDDYYDIFELSPQVYPALLREREGEREGESCTYLPAVVSQVPTGVECFSKIHNGRQHTVNDFRVLFLSPGNLDLDPDKSTFSHCSHAAQGSMRE